MFTCLAGPILDRVRSEEAAGNKQINQKLEEAVTAKQEADARIEQLETKVKEYETKTGKCLALFLPYS